MYSTPFSVNKQRRFEKFPRCCNVRIYSQEHSFVLLKKLKRVNNLNEFCKETEEDFSSPPTFKEIRCLNINKALEFIYKNYLSLISVFAEIDKEEMDLVSKTLLKEMLKPSFLYILLFMYDVTERLKKLLMIFQEKSFNFTRFKDALGLCIENLKTMKEFPDISEYQNISLEIKKFADKRSLHYSLFLDPSLNSKQLRINLIEEILQNIYVRFDHKDIIFAFSIYDSNNIRKNLTTLNYREFEMKN